MGQKEESLRPHPRRDRARRRSSSPATRRCSPSTGSEIFEAATRHKVPVFFEAAVAGGIPIIKAIREAFIGNHIQSIHGIINGTSNYILTRMTESGLSFDAGARRGAGRRLRRGRSHARRERLGRRAQGDHPRLARLRLLGARRQNLRRGHRAHHRRRHPFRPQARLSRSSCSASSRPMPPARSKCACIPRSSRRSTCSRA